MLEFLRKTGFPVSPYLGEPKNAEELVACIRHIEEIRNTLDFLIDGVVIKVGDFALRERMGFTEKFPRWRLPINLKQGGKRYNAAKSYLGAGQNRETHTFGAFGTR